MYRLSNRLLALSSNSKKRYYLRPEPQGPEKQSAHIARAQAHGDNHQSTY